MAQGQDLNITQYFSSPLWYNPANTGIVNGSLRVGGYFKNQNFGSSSSYKNSIVSFDAPIKTFGVGLMVQNNSLSAFNNTAIDLSLGKRFNLNKKGQVLSIGLQAGAVQQSISARSEFVDANEAISNSTQIQPNINAGILWYISNDKKVNPFIGISAYHLLPQTQLSAFNSNDFKVNNRKINANVGLQFNLSQKFDLIPNVLYSQKVASPALSVGLLSHYYFTNTNMCLLAGASYQQNQTIDGIIGLQYNAFTVTASYGNDISNFKTQGLPANSFDISVIYTKAKKSVNKSIKSCNQTL